MINIPRLTIFCIAMLRVSIICNTFSLFSDGIDASTNPNVQENIMMPSISISSAARNTLSEYKVKLLKEVPFSSLSYL